MDKTSKPSSKTNAAAITQIQAEIGALNDRIVLLEKGKNERRVEEGAKPLPVTPLLVQTTLDNAIKPLKEEVASIQKTHNKYLFERKIVTAIVSYYAPDLLQTFIPLPSEVNIPISLGLYLGMDKTADLFNEHLNTILDSIKTKLTQLWGLLVSFKDSLKSTLVYLFDLVKSGVKFLFDKIVSLSEKIATLEWWAFMFITSRWITAPIIFSAIVLGSLHIFKPELGTTAFIVEKVTDFIKTHQIDTLAYGIAENPYVPYLGFTLLVLLGMGSMKAGYNKYYPTPETV